MMRALFEAPPLKRAARAASDFVDLQWSLLIELLKRVAPEAQGRLLDVGCGDKPYEAIFRPHVSEYLGIEHEASFRATSASESGRKPDLYFDGRRLPFDDGSFDTVLNVQVLEHTPHPALLVSEMARVLQPGGVLILSAPFQFRLHELPHDYFRYSPNGLKTLCTNAGLEVTRVYPQGSLWSVLGHKLNSYLAFNVARAGGFAQTLGKLGHEAPEARRPRLWTLPVVAPLMLGVSGAARLLDRALPDPDEALGYLVIARKLATPAPSGPSLP